MYNLFAPEFRKDHPELEAESNGLPFISDDNGESYNYCHCRNEQCCPLEDHAEHSPPSPTAAVHLVSFRNRLAKRNHGNESPVEEKPEAIRECIKHLTRSNEPSGTRRKVLSNVV